MGKGKGVDCGQPQKENRMTSKEKAKVLIVDDREANLTALEAVLDDLDVNVVKARSGKEALQAVLEQDFAVILMDVQMPGIDGFETATLIRGRERSLHTPIVFVTALRTEGSDIDRGYALGATDYILKPFSAPEMKAKVRAYVDLHERRKELAGRLLNLTRQPGKAHILAVDDQPGSLAAIAEILAPLNENVHTAQSGSEALKLLLKYDFALIISDVRMPVMDGFMLAQTIKKNKRYEDVPILFITSLALASEDVARGYKEGAVDYILAPYEPEILRAKVNALLGLHKQKRFLEAQVREIERLNAELNHSGTMLRRSNETLEDRIEERTDALRESEAKFRALAEATPNAIMLYQDDKWVYANPAAEKISGYSSPELLTMHFWDFVHPEHKRLIQERGRKYQEGKTAVDRGEFKIISKDGEEKWASLTGAGTIVKGSPAGIVCVMDITKRKQTDDALKESEERSRLIAETISEVFWMADVKIGKMFYISPAYEHIWGRSLQSLYENPRSFIEAIHPDDVARVLADFETQKTGRPFAHEYRIRRPDGTLRWIWDRGFPIHESTGEVLRYTGIAQDITERKREEEELRQALESLRKAVGATIQVMVSAVETRDPYTAGHQIRSADLARAIAVEMGLPQEKIDGIRMAGTIHDIGKLSTPAEILSKPTKLSDIEFSLIKEHVRQGYEILKDVESPWPLAEMVRQHHERMDGSGYPRGLKGEAIMVESRILAVSDVVESMASHRPYRAALGLNAALEEIEKNQGTLYDADVVAACLRLFREKRYELPKA
jgi:PAS domain S-box-containing protein/putative nucleotidyltransferase with HDIG domain